MAEITCQNQIPKFEYFTPSDADQYAYYRIPKMLITGERFRDVSMEAKLLYGILLDRVSLSLKNGWVDKNNHVYIIFTIEQIMEEMNCGNKKAVMLLSELEKKIGLVEKKRQGLGRPNLIYVKNFFLAEYDQQDPSASNGSSGRIDGFLDEALDSDGDLSKEVDDASFSPVLGSDKAENAEFSEVSKGNFQKCQNDTSGNVKKTSQEMSNGHGTKTDIIKTDYTKTDINILSNPFVESGESNTGADWIDGADSGRRIGNSRQDFYAPEAACQRIDGVEEYNAYRAYFIEQLEIDILIHDNPYDRETFEGILDILVETCTSKKPMIRVSGQELPTVVVRSKLMKLNIQHIRYVMHCMQQNSNRIRNIRQYLLTALFNAPSTINQFYQALVNNDIQNGSV